jgi:hypothetical protein
VDDQDVAMRMTGYPLADAAAEEALDESRLARPDDDQIGAVLFGGFPSQPCAAGPIR